MYDGLKNLDVPHRRRPRAKRVLKVGLLLVLVISLGVGVSGWVVFNAVNRNLNKGRIEVENLEKALPKGPINILVLGSDRRDVIEGDARNERQYKGGGGQRADTIILVHVNTITNHAVIMSFPRDLRVAIPGHGFNKINAAYTFGGASLVIKTIKQLSGLPINHYVEVNFSSFRAVVDAVGGVGIYVNRPLEDKRAGLHLPRAGCYVMNGDTALAFVRARHIDPTADLGRIQRQQLFMRVLMRKVKSIGFILNPGKVLSLSRAIGKGVRYDPGVNIKLARAIANRLAGFDQKRVDFRIVPGFGRYIRGVSYIVPNQKHASQLFAAIGADAPLPDWGKTTQSVPVPADVTVKILNGSGVNGFAGKQAARLRRLGYRIGTVATAPAETNATIITYTPESEMKAELLQKIYPSAIVRPASKPQVTNLVLTAGRDIAVATASPSASGTPSSAKPTPRKPARVCG